MAEEERYTDELSTRVCLVAAAYVLLLRAPQGAGSPGAVQVLLHLRRNTGYRDGHWALAAGHVDPGESVVEAAVREVREEAGVAVASTDLLALTTVHRTVPGGGPREQRADVFFAARSWTGEPRVMEPAKNIGWRWWPLAEVSAGLDAPCVPHELAVMRLVAEHGTSSPAGVPAVLTHGF